jgi:hypothetical protein
MEVRLDKKTVISSYSRYHASEVQSFLVLGNREQGTGNRG